MRFVSTLSVTLAEDSPGKEAWWEEHTRGLAFTTSNSCRALGLIESFVRMEGFVTFSPPPSMISFVAFKGGSSNEGEASSSATSSMSRVTGES